jgi:polysaccharide deacetylase 2 family uncharacterized protein YibQ
MKKSRFSKVFWPLLAAVTGALGLWIVHSPVPPKHVPVSVDVAVEQPPASEPSAPPQGEEAQTAGAVAPALPEREAAPASPEHKPEIAIVIDDVGLNLAGSQRAIKLPGYVTLSFMPYAERLDEQTAAAREAGHELLLHMPMEPIGREDPGPGALYTTYTAAELKSRLDHALDSFEGFDGVNNHMGSRFTAYAPGMEIVMDELQKRHLFFLDSRTSAQSVGFAIAQKDGLPSVTRDVFLDDSLNPEAIKAQLAATEKVAKRKGYAVAIGHPHENTLGALEAWLPEAEKEGFTFVPVHDLLRNDIVKVNGP